MPWKEVTVVSSRKEFVFLALRAGVKITDLCQGFNISRKTGYKWINRYLSQGEAGLEDESRQPHRSPGKTAPELETAVLKLRSRHPAWGGRKIHSRLLALGHESVPAASTITDILRRYGLIDPQETEKHRAWQSFEAEAPNDLWQMDFKGHFSMAQGRCHPLTTLDDHSRYALCLAACIDEKGVTVQERMRMVFRRYGLPRRLLVDNGSPWGAHERHIYTPLTVWLMRLGIIIIHSRPYHPQTLGKEERFHRSLKAEVTQYCGALSLELCQQRFDQWRQVYNCQRPHEALKMQVPASRYQPSPRRFPEKLPPIEYSPQDAVRKVQANGWISFHNREYRLSKAFRGEYVALRPTQTDGLWEAFFCNQMIDQIDLRCHNKNS
jgi:transposase InsO family protein